MVAFARRAAIATALVVPAVALAASHASARVTLTLQVIGPGAVVATPGSRCVGYLERVHVCRTSYARGARVRLELSSRGGRLVGTGLIRTVTMNRPRLVTAKFVKRPPAPQPAPPAPAVGTRTNPVPLGAPIDIIDTFSQEHWRLRIVSTQPNATAAVMAEDQSNDPPTAGSQFFIATVKVTFVSGIRASNPGIRIAGDLKAVGPSNVVYSTLGTTSRCGVIPDAMSDKGDLLPGASSTGNICWQVPTAEAGSLIAFYELDNRPYYMALR